MTQSQSYKESPAAPFSGAAGLVIHAILQTVFRHIFPVSIHEKVPPVVVHTYFS